MVEGFATKVYAVTRFMKMRQQRNDDFIMAGYVVVFGVILGEKE